MGSEIFLDRTVESKFEVLKIPPLVTPSFRQDDSPAHSSDSSHFTREFLKNLFYPHVTLQRVLLSFFISSALSSALPEICLLLADSLASLTATPDSGPHVLRDSTMPPSSDSPAETKLTLFQLPPELLCAICSMLPLDSQGCLALTCKTYYLQFNSVFCERFFKVPRLPTNPANLEKRRLMSILQSWNKRGIARSVFLIRAQTKDLRYCAGCRTLHPRNEFKKTQLSIVAEFRHCKRPANVPLYPWGPYRTLPDDSHTLA